MTKSQWGKENIVPKTVAATLDQFKVGVPVDVLTKTFQVAIDICQRLEIEYLWIDSLCILQDDEADWKDQASKMVGIYQNSILTIAATKSSEPLGGIYSRSKYPTYNLADGIPIRELNPKFPIRYFMDHKSWPLLQRTWVYQERIFSQRVLHFGEHEVIWECKPLRRGQSWDCDLRVASEGDILSISTSWDRYVEMYSILQLTFDSDKLVALSSLAIRMALSRPGDRYVAGLWQKTLLRDLTWYANCYSLKPRSASYICPSWSWASVESGVLFGPDRELPCIIGVSVVDISCPKEYSGCSSSQGHECPSPSITVRSPLLEAKFLRKFSQVQIEAGKATSITIDRLHDIISEDETIDIAPDYKYDAPGRFYVSPESTVYLLPLLKRNLVDETSSIYQCLLLRRLDGSSLYERIAKVDLWHKKLDSEQNADAYMATLPFIHVTIV